MESFSELLQHGAANAWWFLPSAVLLGALHGLEPGHSKTMMAAFIIAIKGTIPQAVLLGLSAAASHTAIVWILAIAGMAWGDELIAEDTEPYFMMVSGGIVIVVALWMLWRGWMDFRASQAHEQGHHHHHDEAEGHHHHHAVDDEMDLDDDAYQDAHQRAHALEIKTQFADRKASTSQVVLFGLSGGLIPCPASVTVLIICLQLDHFWLGMATVGAFSVGLAVTLVGVGVIAAWGVQHASNRLGGLDRIARYTPFLTSGVIIILGSIMIHSGLSHLAH
ncbi:MAG: nickel/cobalt efflux transporter RcnA [Magnetococcales bacterium]|nr:nickel/cobalt efflux transporter RcnA [Magnetococcales bacterium]